MKFIYTLTILLISVINLYSQNETAKQIKANISGNIYDSHTKKPISYANVTLYKATDSLLVTGNVTDDNGNYVLANIKDGNYYLIANFIGYNKKTINNITINDKIKKIKVQDIFLEQSTQNISEVQVVAQKDYIEYKIDKKVINVDQSLNATGGTAIDVLKNVPSVSVDIEGNVAIRGNTNYTVLIDGKPSIMDGNDILNQYPASSIEKIELITNPSAKYDPEGTAGIINIILKKEKRDGFNGIVNLSAGKNDKYNADFLFNLRKKKFNYFIGASYNNKWNLGNSKTINEIYNSDTINNLVEDGDMRFLRQSKSINGGFDYAINPNNSITFAFNYREALMKRNKLTSYNSYDSYNDDVLNSIYSLSDNRYSMHMSIYSFDLSYQKKFKKEDHKVLFFTNVSTLTGLTKENSVLDYTNNLFNKTSDGSRNRSQTNADRQNYQLKIDYTNPLKIGKFESGFQYTTGPNGDIDFIYEDFDLNSVLWINNTNYSNILFFNQSIYATYATFSSKFKEFEYQLGLRYEITDRIIEQKTTNEKYLVNLSNYYPTVHINKKLTKDRNIQLSYSKRVNRPKPWLLNPYPNFSDLYNLSKGNPYLKPEDINAFEINYQKNYKKMFYSLGTYYNLTTNSIVRIITIDELNRKVSTMGNFDKKESYGFELMLNIDPKKWININLSGNLYNMSVNGNITGENVKDNSFNYETKLATNFTITKTTKFQLTGVYNSPSVDIQGEKSEVYYFDFGIKQDVFKKKASLTLNIQDVFKTRTSERTILNKSYYTFEKMNREYQVYMITFSYKINNFKKQKPNNQGGEVEGLEQM